MSQKSPKLCIHGREMETKWRFTNHHPKKSCARSLSRRLQKTGTDFPYPKQLSSLSGLITDNWEEIPSLPRSCRFNGCSHLPAPPQTTQNSSGLAAALQKRYHVLRGTPPLGNQQDRFFLWFYGGFLFLYAFFFSFFLKGVLSYKALQRNSRTCCNTETKWTNSTDSYSTGWTG